MNQNYSEAIVFAKQSGRGFSLKLLGNLEHKRDVTGKTKLEKSKQHTL